MGFIFNNVFVISQYERDLLDTVQSDPAASLPRLEGDVQEEDIPQVINMPFTMDKSYDMV